MIILVLGESNRLSVAVNNSRRCWCAPNGPSSTQLDSTTRVDEISTSELRNDQHNKRKCREKQAKP